MSDVAVAEPLDLLTTRQAGERLGLAGAYISQLVHAEKLQPFAFAGTQRNALFRPEDIDAIAARREADRRAVAELAASAAP